MNNTLNANLNNLEQYNIYSNTNQSENIQSNINSSYIPTLSQQKQLVDYDITIFADKQLNLVNSFIISNNYQDLAKLLNNDKNILPKLIVLPKEQSIIITAIIKKKYACVEVLCNAILKNAKKKSIPQYLQQYLFVFACENFDTDSSKSIVKLYKNTAINLTSEQIILLLDKSIQENNLQLSQLLITKFITLYDDTIKNKKYTELVKYAIKMNKLQVFNALLDLDKHNQIDIFNKEIIKNIIPDLIKSNNISLLNKFLIKAISMKNKNILFEVVYFFILFGGQSFSNISLVFSIIEKNPYLLLIKNKDSITILHAAFFKKQPNYALKLLKNPIVKEYINNPFYYTAIKHKSKHNIAEIALTNCRNSHYKKNLRTIKVTSLKKFSCIHKLTINSKYQQNKSVDYLDLATSGLEQKSQAIFTEIINHIADISCLGIYLYNQSLMIHNKNSGQSYSFGDENAAINIINRLVFLGCRNINLYIPFIESIAKNAKNIIINKIACLLNIKIKDKNHIIKKAQCTIKFCFIKQDEYACIPDDLVLTFNALHLFKSTKNVKKVITLRPFLFSKYFEEMFIKKTNDENDLNYKISALNNPIYSILKEEKDSLPLSYGAISDNRKWYTDLLTQTLKTSKANLIVNCITAIAENIQTISHGVVYGLHHNDIHNKEDILDNWINLLKISSNQNDKKTIVLSIPANTLSLNIKKLSTIDTIIFDLINKEYKFSVIEKAFKQKNNIIIILYPNLPKVIFYYLIDQANIPILIEGANTTSYALQTAKPYLSLLPSGKTAIPRTMGDSLQALLMEATSYKITMNPEYLAVTKEIFDLAKQERYQDAINLICNLDKNSSQNQAIQFFCCYYADQDYTYKYAVQYKDKITILFLLYKGKSLSVFGREYLLQILDPDMQNVADYVEKCKELDSHTTWHFKLMQQHVNLEINNAIDFSLYKLFKQI